MTLYIPRSLSNTRQYLFLGLLVLLSFFSQNCDPDDDGMEPTRKYHCSRSDFTNDCLPYNNIGESTGYGHTGMEAAAPTFIPWSSDEIIFTQDNNDDKLEASKIIRYNWRTRTRTVLVDNSPMIHEYDITQTGWVCAEISSGPIIYFHLDSPSTTVKEVPFDEGIVKEPAWLSDGETIIYLADSHDLRFRLWSFNTVTNEKVRLDNIPKGTNSWDFIPTSISSNDDLILSVAGKGYHVVNFHDLSNATYFMSFDQTTNPAGNVIRLRGSPRMYYTGPWLISYGEGDQEYGIRDLCLGDEQIQYMDVSEDEKFIVYLFEYPVEFRGGKRILTPKLRIIDIENCKEYEINPFE